MNTPKTLDETAIHALHQQMMKGWNIGSGAAFSATFSEDAHLIGFDGTHLVGHSVIADFQQRLFDKWLKGTRLVGRLERIQFLSPDIALVHAVGTTVMAGKTQPRPERDSIQTLVATKHDGQWQFSAFQNTRIRPMSQGFVAWLLSDWLWKVLGPKQKTTP